jgi:hypothetical protein
MDLYLKYSKWSRVFITIDIYRLGVASLFKEGDENIDSLNWGLSIL